MIKTKITYRTLYYCVYPEHCKGWTTDREFTGPTALTRLNKYLNKNCYLENRKGLKVVRIVEEELTRADLRDIDLVDASDPRLA